MSALERAKGLLVLAPHNETGALHSYSDTFTWADLRALVDRLEAAEKCAEDLERRDQDDHGSRLLSAWRATR